MMISASLFLISHTVSSNLGQFTGDHYHLRYLQDPDDYLNIPGECTSIDQFGDNIVEVYSYLVSSGITNYEERMNQWILVAQCFIETSGNQATYCHRLHDIIFKILTRIITGGPSVSKCRMKPSSLKVCHFNSSFKTSKYENLFVAVRLRWCRPCLAGARLLP
jgi:hypothetical protein